MTAPRPPATEAEGDRRNAAAMERADANPARTLADLRALWSDGDPTHDMAEVDGAPTATPTNAYSLRWFVDAMADKPPGEVLGLLHSLPGGGGLSLLAWGVEAAEGADRPLARRHLIVREERRPPKGKRPLLLARAPGALRLATLAAVEVDGEAFATRTIGGVTKRTRRRRLAAPAQGELWPGPRTLAGQATAGAVVEALASEPLDGDERSPLRPDVLKLGDMAYALTGSLRMGDGEGAELIGGADTPANRERYWRALMVGRALTYWSAEGKPYNLMDTEGGDINRIGPPRWWLDYWRVVEGIPRKDRAARKAARKAAGLSGDPIGWRLSGILFLPVEAPATGEGKREDRTAHRWAAVARTVAGIEGALVWGPTAGRGTGGRIPDDLRPARKGDPGPEVLIPWWQVLRLSGENVGPDADTKGAEGRRYRRRVEALRMAGYFTERTATAERGGTVEVVEARRGCKARRAGLVVRASARYCTAYAGGKETRISADRLLPGPRVAGDGS